jgi:hypothetical protein
MGNAGIFEAVSGFDVVAAARILVFGRIGG